MHKIDGQNATVDNEFQSGSAASGTPGTTVTPEWLNSVQRELINILTNAGVTPDKGDDTQVLDSLKIGLGVPIGAILEYAGATSPGGYLLCDGSEISRTTYSNLYAIIGTTYGVGDGVNTFNLPNDAGKIIKF